MRASTLERLRRRELEYMPRTAHEVAAVRVPVAGGTTEQWTNVLQSFACRVVVVQQGERCRVSAPYGTSVADTSRLLIDGVMYEIVGTDEEQTYSTATHFLCYEVDDGD